MMLKYNNNNNNRNSSRIQILHSYLLLVCSIFFLGFCLQRHDNDKNVVFCNALSSASRSPPVMKATGSDFLPTVSLKSSRSSQLAILDGSEWSSIQNILRQENRFKKGTAATRYGYTTIVTGTTNNDDDDDSNQRVIAMKIKDNDDNDDDNKCVVYKDSIAAIPDNVSDQDAISTYITALSTIQPTLPYVEKVGGSSERVVGGTSVVLGSNELACFAAEGLATLGVDCYLVSNNGNPKVNKNIAVGGKLNVLKPAVGSSQIGFAAHIDKFDSLLDTLGDEGIPLPSFFVDDDDDDFSSLGGSVLELLKSRHDCHRYVSTYTYSQSIIQKEGVFSGPGKANDYLKRTCKNPTPFLKSPDCQHMPPMGNIGQTMTMIFNKGIIFTQKQRQKFHDKSSFVKGWTLSDFWEQTTWPRDSNGNGNTRFGLPTKDDDQDLYDDDEDEFDDDGRLILEAPKPFPKREFELTEPTDTRTPPIQPVQDNPYVLKLTGVYGITTEIIDKELDCIMFLSARFCKTCKSIDPLYTRMARIFNEKSSDVKFVKAEASGPYGKELGRNLEVDAVPAFILFRQGKRYGTPLSVSKFPSKKIDRAINLLETGQPWDNDILKEES